jgi:hypothetical protein
MGADTLREELTLQLGCGATNTERNSNGGCHLACSHPMAWPWGAKEELMSRRLLIGCQKEETEGKDSG